MKTLKTAPSNQDIFTHEGPTARVLSSLTWFFVLVSTITVTGAWYIFLEDHLATLGDWKWPAVALIGLCFALPVEAMIYELSKYFWRSQIKGLYKGAHTGQFVTASILLLLGLTYSVFMSQKATRAAMTEAAPKQMIIETGDIEKEYRKTMRGIGETFSANAETIEKRFAETEKAVSRRYAATLDSLAKEYAIWDAKGSRYKRKVEGISRAMLAQQTGRANDLAILAQGKAAEMAALQDTKQSAETKAGELKQANVEIVSAKTVSGNEGKASFANVFGAIVSVVAALAVLFVFLLARFVELFYHRTGIKRVVFLDSTDMNTSVFVEALRYPAVYVSRHVGAWVQRKYEALPKPLPPLRPETVYDPEGLKQEVVNAAKIVSPHIAPPNLVPVSYPPPKTVSPAVFEWKVQTPTETPETLFETRFQPVSPEAVSVELEVAKPTETKPEPTAPKQATTETPADWNLLPAAKQLELARGKVRSYRSRLAKGLETVSEMRGKLESVSPDDRPALLRKIEKGEATNAANAERLAEAERLVSSVEDKLKS